MRFLVIALLAAGCFPTFDKVDCYSALDCPSTAMCIDGACVETGVDAGKDASTPDADPDAGPIDATDPTDGSEPDAEEADASEQDATSDAGYAIQASPQTIDFGERPVRCVGPGEVATITNLGVTPVRITDLALAGGTSSAFSIAPIATPFTLNPAVSRTVTLDFLPGSIGLHNGRLLVSYEPEPLPLTVDLTGRAVAGSTVTETFTQSGGAIDILFVVDDNAGMVSLQERLANHAIFLLSLLDFEAWDYQLGVTTADLGAQGARGALIGTPVYLTRNNVVDPQAELEMRVMLGEAASPADEGLEASRLALSAPLITIGTNTGFLRANAALLVIYLSKASDGSAMTVANYTAFLEALETDPARVQANAIVPTVTACTLDDGTLATMGDRQIEMAQTTGGAVSDACDTNWLDAMTTLPMVELEDVFPLGYTPRSPSTIEVRVGGAVIQSGGGTNWSYDANQNAIVFAPGREPGLGETIEITYPAGC
jgi:hypothetical protein